MAAIKYEGHDHLLQWIQFKNNIGGGLYDVVLECSVCNKSTCGSYGFSCLSCEFNLHHTCGPLPSTIKHKSHIHPLILTNSPAQHEDETNDEFYCDACEEERPDPLLPIYQCIECHFAADIKCLISEVIASLNGKYGDAELRNPLGQFGKVIAKDTAKEMMQKKEKQLKPTLTWYDVFQTWTEDEKKEKNLLRERIKKTTTAQKIEAYEYEEILMFFDKAYTHSKVSIDKFPFVWDLSSHTKEEEVVNVGDYMTTRKLAPILKHLLSNHKDIGANCTLSPQLKSLLFYTLCDCIDRMRNTMVVDITHDILQGWWRCLRILQFVGFKVDFVFGRLKRVTNAHFGLYVESQVDNTLDQLDRDIEALTRKRERIKSAKSAKFSLNIEECLREGSLLGKGKAVASNLL